MINVEWKENGKLTYENLLSDLFLEDFVNKLEIKGCTEIQVTQITKSS